MNRPDAHARYEELAAGYALHALEPEDDQEFTAHLAACDLCRADLAEHEAALAQLAYAPAGAEPPPSLLEGIRADVLASGREASFPADMADQPPSLDAARTRRDATRYRRAATWLGAAAALALIVSLGVWNAALREDNQVQAAWSARMAEAVASLRDDATETVPLAGEGGRVVAVALMHDDQMSLVVDGLPVTAPGTSYVLWGQSQYGDKRAVGAFHVTSTGVDVLDGMRLPDGVSDVTKLMVTREQGDQPPAIPTLPVLASGDV